MQQAQQMDWALDALRNMGYKPEVAMSEKISNWWSWYDCSNAFYAKPKNDINGAGPALVRMTLKPARMVCDEYASLLMADNTTVSTEDASLAAFIADDLDGLIENNAWLVSRAFALGSAAFIPDFELTAAGKWKATMRGYDARSLIILSSSERTCKGLAVVSRVDVEGTSYDQLKVIALDPETATYHIKVRLFDTKDKRKEFASEKVAADFDTHSQIPPFALITPAISNTYDDYTPLGVSVYDDGLDVISTVDLAFTMFHWELALTQARVFLDESAVRRDKGSGEPIIGDTINQVLYATLGSGIGEGNQPVTIYSPPIRTDSYEVALNDALSMLSFKCGMGNNYFSFTRAEGLKTATEVVSNNSNLMRNVKKHERLIGQAIEQAVRGAYGVILGTQTAGIIPDSFEAVPKVEIAWDDSTIIDTETERSVMKDDIARGLAPAYLYTAKYYGVDEAEARRITGEAQAEAALGEL